MSRPPTDPLTISMADLVRLRDASVRLTNCVCGDSWLSQQTVRDFIEGGAPLFDKILKVQNLGRKTATELRELINRHVTDSGGLAEFQRQTPVDLSVDGDPVYGPPVPTPFQSLMDILDPIGFPEVITSFDISMRLRHHLQEFASMQAIEGRWEAEILSVADVLRRWNEVTSHFLGTKNFGRRSLSELRATIETVIARRLEWSDAAHSTSDAVSVESIAKGNLEPELAALIEEARNAGIKRASDGSASDQLENDDHWFAVDPTLVNLPPREQIARVIAALADQEKDVILRRFGIGSFAPQTLEEIATKFFVTRERVRQVEARALKRLRLKGRAAAFQGLLESEQASVWEFLAEYKNLLLPTDLQRNGRHFDGEFRLAVEVLHGSLMDWAGIYGRSAHGGWIRADRSATHMANHLDKVLRYINTVPMPRSTSSVAGQLGLSSDDVSTALQIGSDVSAYDGYLCTGL